MKRVKANEPGALRTAKRAFNYIFSGQAGKDFSDALSDPKRIKKPDNRPKAKRVKAK